MVAALEVELVVSEVTESGPSVVDDVEAVVTGAGSPVEEGGEEEGVLGVVVSGIDVGGWEDLEDVGGVDEVDGVGDGGVVEGTTVVDVGVVDVRAVDVGTLLVFDVGTTDEVVLVA